MFLKGGDIIACFCVDKNDPGEIKLVKDRDGIRVGEAG